MEENTITSQKDLFGNDLKVLPKKPEGPVAGPSTSSSEWPSLQASQVTKESLASSISPGQRPPASPATTVSWPIKKRSAEDYKKDKVGKYAPYFQGNHILSIPKLVTAVEPKTLPFSYIRSDDQDINKFKEGDFRGAAEIR